MARSKDISKTYPNEDGIIAETTTQQGHVMNLIPEEGSTVGIKEREGL